MYFTSRTYMMLSLRCEQARSQGTINDVNLLASKDNGSDHYAEQKKVRNHYILVLLHTVWTVKSVQRMYTGSSHNVVLGTGKKSHQVNFALSEYSPNANLFN